MLEKDSKIYVAGHRGLVGSAIWNNLQARGFHNLLGKSHAELDLMDPIATREFFEREQPDAVVLAAAHVGGIMANSKYRADFIYNNLQIQHNVIGESWRNGVKKLLFLGSTCIYPRDVEQPMREDALLTAPLEYTNEPYAIAKIAGLKMCESFNLQYGTNFIAVMPTNLYGPNDNFHLENSHVLPAMIRKIHLAKLLNEGDLTALREDLSKRPIPGFEVNDASMSDIVQALDSYGIAPNRVTLWGSGTPLREFLWSEDMADASVHVLLNVEFDQLHEAGASEVRNCHINIGTGEEISIKELAYLIARTEEFEGDILWDKSKPDGTPRKLTNVCKLHQLGWRHQVEIRDGVERLYQWYLNH
ncbi:GDP-L-fucose synthase [Porphyromonadaceae bacterium W3.11]|nr:GDP-L-fucose synthase [Porphyromonadaceae bacterium W3.11]